MANLQHALCRVENIKVRSVRGRIWVEHAGRTPFSEAELAVVSGKLRNMFGMESFSPAILVDSEMSGIAAALRAAAPAVFEPAFEKLKKVKFRIRARRSDKSFPLCSKDIEIALATVVGDLYPTDDLMVHLDDDADITVGCEVREEFTILFFESFRSGGGLPTGSNSPALALLSGGIDSPVACLLTMKRGSEVDYISFHSDPYTPPETIEKVLGIGRYLDTFQRKGCHYMVNLSEFQKLVRDNCSQKYRTILYRRAMVRLAARAAKNGRCKALVTGESLGQVASQTLENMSVINAAAEGMLILRPLVGQDKLETIRLAEKYGTLGLSNVQVPDSCTVFAPAAPCTKSTVEELEREEAKIPNYREVLEKIFREVEVY